MRIGQYNFYNLYNIIYVSSYNYYDLFVYNYNYPQILTASLWLVIYEVNFFFL